MGELTKCLAGFWAATLTMGALTLAPLRAQTEQLRLILKGEWSEAGSDWSATSVQVVSNYAFVAELRWLDTNRPGRLAVLDLSNPTNPVPLGFYETSNQVKGVHVVGSLAYLAEGTWRTGTNDPGALEIVDVRNPTNLVRLGGINTQGCARRVQVAGHLAYVSESQHWTGSNLLGSLTVFDVSNPSNPIRVGAYQTAGDINDVQVAGIHAYVAGGNADLLVLDVSNPASPALVGSYSTNVVNPDTGLPGGPSVDVQVVGNYVFAASPEGLHLFDVSTLENPLPIGSFIGPPTHLIHVAGKFGFVAFSFPISPGPTGYLGIFDARNLPALGSNGGVIGGTSWVASDVAVMDQYAYVAAGNAGLLVFEIKTVSSPSITSVTREGNKLILSWAGVPGLRLQRSESIDGERWLDVPDSEGQSRIELPLSNDHEFFRLSLDF